MGEPSTSVIAGKLQECLALVDAEDRLQVRALRDRIGELEAERQRFGDVIAELGRHLLVMGRDLPPERAAGVDGHQATCRRITRLAAAYADGREWSRSDDELRAGAAGDPSAEAGDQLTVDDIPALLAGIVGLAGYRTAEELEGVRRALTRPGQPSPPAWDIYVFGVRDGLRGLVANLAGLYEEVTFAREHPGDLEAAIAAARAGEPR